MARVKINGKVALSYDYEKFVEIYWTKLSEFIIKKYGRNKITDKSTVENVLLDCFRFLIEEFKKLIYVETNYRFFSYVFYLHEQSLEIYKDILGGYKLTEIEENDFARYRRILKLILEQGCDIDLKMGKFPTGEEVLAMDEKIQALFYLGTWIYTFADYTAYQKMIEEAHDIDFDKEGQLLIGWQHHYGAIYKNFFPKLMSDYEKGTFDENAIHELKGAINDCFEIDYDFAGGIIFEIKKHFSPKAPKLQTIEPYILPQNLKAKFGIDQLTAEYFYNGLSISRENKMSLEEVILKPYSTERYMYRPILIYNIDGVKRALVGEEKFAESMLVLATNAISWNTIPKEWRANSKMVKFISRKGNEHDKILEDKIEEVLLEKRLLYCRNIKSFKQPNAGNIRIDNELAGEIDYIVVNLDLKKIFVADSKYNKVKYEAVGYRTDYTNFLKSYEPQLQKKINWISENKNILQEHLKIIYNIADLDLSDFEIDGIFFINTPTFYMFNGNYKAITLKQIPDYLMGKYEYPTVFYENEEGVKSIINHPYFIKPKK